MSKLSIVIPVYFNAPSLPELHSRIRALVEKDRGLELEIIFVDDGSGDDSFVVIRQLAAADPQVVGIRLSRNFGSFNAILAGLIHATGDCVAIISADLQDPPELISDMVDHWRKGVKVVMAVRERREENALKVLCARIYYYFFRIMINKDMPIGGFDFVLIDRLVANALCAMREKNTTLMGLILWAGFSREMLYYVRRERKHGTSRWTIGKKIDYFIDSFLSFSKTPLRFFSLLGLSASAFALFGIIYVIVASAWGLMDVAGWPSLMVVTLLFFGITLSSVGIIGEYVWRALDESRNRPSFLVEEELRSANVTTCKDTCLERH
ncbi:MAG: glycosyltransferase family 2 protein [Desulfovibrionaceae bacterium]|nr:glycosyltransferase family 2 protein [Desulfovibrionaceae bacterium]MBF0515151.1 glycosyltransferase family 2 protein [Desulfovibrionaceae bacterium]